MIDNRRWIALFSHTGSEIVNISNRLGYDPDLIITNNKPGTDTIHEGIRDVVYTKSKPSAEDYESLFEGDPIVTLHGWMRIVPGSVCDNHTIYNLHPGLIDEYPELKGKDPQQQVFNMLNTPSHVGCVIHRATAQLDDGPITMSRRVTNHYATPNVLVKALHEMAGDMWVDFFENKLYMQ